MISEERQRGLQAESKKVLDELVRLFYPARKRRGMTQATFKKVLYQLFAALGLEALPNPTLALDDAVDRVPVETCPRARRTNSPWGNA